jgi:4-amino-4-deoxy-L-arabinose transferase-like glycosyltransferase
VVYRYALVGGGALLPLVGIIIFYHIHGYTLRELYDSLLASNFRYLQRGYEYASSLRSFSLIMRVILPENCLIWLGTIFASTYIVWQSLQGKGQKSDLLLFWWAFWSFAVLWVSGTFFWHYFLQIVAPFSVLAAYGVITSWKLTKFLSPLSKHVLRGVWVTILGISTFVFMKTDYKYFFSYSPIKQTMFQHKVSDGVFEGYGVYNIVQHEIVPKLSMSGALPHKSIS